MGRPKDKQRYGHLAPLKWQHDHDGWQHAAVCRECNTVLTLLILRNGGSFFWGDGMSFWDPCPHCGAFKPSGKTGQNGATYNTRARRVETKPEGCPFVWWNPFTWHLVLAVCDPTHRVYYTPPEYTWEVWQEKTDLEKIAEAGNTK